MRSTGEVMGIDSSFGLAFAKSQMAAGDELPAGGTVFFSLADRDKAGRAWPSARRFVAARLPVGGHLRHGRLPRGRRGAGGHGRGQGERRGEGADPPGLSGAGADAVDLIRDGKVDLVVNTPRGRGPRADGAYIRRAANQHRVACLTTVAAARAAAAGHRRAGRPARWQVRSLQEYHSDEQEQLPMP